VAQDQLLSAQLQLTSANFDRTIFYLDLIRATGRLPEVAVTPATRPATTRAATQPSTQPATQAFHPDGQ
jgi:hypothetical protein